MRFFIELEKKTLLLLFIKNDKHSNGNYIPVSLLSICGKILNRFLYNNLFSFFIENDLLSQKQSAIILCYSALREKVQLLFFRRFLLVLKKMFILREDLSTRQ